MWDFMFRLWMTNEEFPNGKMYYDGDLFNDKAIFISMCGELYYFENNSLDSAVRLFSKNNVKLMQYIGRNDFSGKKIYEGDIIITQFLDGESGKVDVISEVFFCEDRLKFTARHPNGKIVEIGQEEEISVLGNIYENPNLLDKGD